MTRRLRWSENDPLVIQLICTVCEHVLRVDILAPPAPHWYDPRRYVA